MAIEPETKTVSFWEKARKPLPMLATATVLASASACNSDVLLATWSCKQWPRANTADAGDWKSWFEPVWSTGFEDEFCGYREAHGYCYTSGSATYRIVNSPVHSGHYAAAYTVIADGADSGTNSRCFLGGELPQQGYYSAWFYLPKPARLVGNSNWNLVHFQGGDTPNMRVPNTWDISLENADDGGLRLKVVDYVERGGIPDLLERPPVPIGKWFRIQTFLKRSTDATGTFRVYQDDVKILDATNVITDAGPYSEWYVGNLADNLDPAEYTIYVDDVSVGPQS